MISKYTLNEYMNKKTLLMENRLVTTELETRSLVREPTIDW